MKYRGYKVKSAFNEKVLFCLCVKVTFTGYIALFHTMLCSMIKSKAAVIAAT